MWFLEKYKDQGTWIEFDTSCVSCFHKFIELEEILRKILSLRVFYTDYVNRKTPFVDFGKMLEIYTLYEWLSLSKILVICLISIYCFYLKGLVWKAVN